MRGGGRPEARAPRAELAVPGLLLRSAGERTRGSELGVVILGQRDAVSSGRAGGSLFGWGAEAVFQELAIREHARHVLALEVLGDLV